MVKSSSLSPATVRNVALPTEHGGWMFLIEPILLGLGLSFSIPGLFLALAASAVFLLRQPLKILVDDLRRRKRFARTGIAIRFSIAYGAAALVFGVLAAATADIRFVIPLLMATPLVILQLWFDFGKRSRDLAAELSGSVAMGAIAPAIALMSSWKLADALFLWLILIARFIPAIIYVRQRLRLEYGKTTQVWPVFLTHVIALVAVGAMAIVLHAPWIPMIALLLLLGRAAYGLSRWRIPARPQAVGIQETVFGICTVIIYLAGYLAAR